MSTKAALYCLEIMGCKWVEVKHKDTDTKAKVDVGILRVSEEEAGVIVG
jgi:hypothetical protein